MNLVEFQKFIDEQDALFKSLFRSSTEKEEILSRVVKISEEFGELCDEVLARVGEQRKGKMEGRTKEDLEDEFADVVITTFLLAKMFDVDMPSVLARKTATIRAKHNKELKAP